MAELVARWSRREVPLRGNILEDRVKQFLNDALDAFVVAVIALGCFVGTMALILIAVTILQALAGCGKDMLPACRGALVKHEPKKDPHSTPTPTPTTTPPPVEEEQGDCA